MATEEKLYLTSVMQPTLSWAYNDRDPEFYNKTRGDHEQTLLTPSDKEALAERLSSGPEHLPVVLEHANMRTADSTPEHAIVGHVSDMFVDARQNFIGCAECDFSHPAVKRIYDDLEYSRQNPTDKRRRWGVSQMTYVYADGRRRLEHLGLTQNPAFGQEGSWIKVYGRKKEAYEQKIKSDYLEDVGMYIPRNTQAKYEKTYGKVNRPGYFRPLMAVRASLDGTEQESPQILVSPSISYESII